MIIDKLNITYFVPGVQTLVASYQFNKQCGNQRLLLNI